LSKLEVFEFGAHQGLEVGSIPFLILPRRAYSLAPVGAQFLLLFSQWHLGSGVDERHEMALIELREQHPMMLQVGPFLTC
jgi:hypothetical protein